MKTNQLNIFQNLKYLNNHLLVFFFYWLIAFIIYLPAAKAGLVGDMPYMFDSINNKSFLDFLNPGNGIALYQLAALNFYVLIKLLGTNVWLWHLLYVTVHAINGMLLFKFFSRLLKDSAIDNAVQLSFIAVCLFIICPHASEVVVWKASNHHSVATAIIFLILLLVQRFIKSQKPGYALIAGLLFFYSSFSHEFFYLTPWFTLVLICYYHFVLRYDKSIFKKSVLYFFVPIILLFILHLVLLRIVKHTYVSHFGKMEQMSVFYYLDKPLKYFFHVVFLGRFFSSETRHKIYAFCETKTAISAFYGLFLCFSGYVVFRFKEVSMKLKAIALVSIFLMIVYIFLSPVYFADSLLVCYDRYVYPSLGFAFLFVVLLVSLIPVKWIRIVLITGYALINLWFTIKVNIYWKQSAYVIKRLLNDVPDPGNKIVLLLNLPDNLNGIPMISAEHDGRFKMMHNTLTKHPYTNKIYDIAAYNMLSADDGAHVIVANDSTLHVTLNQWGTWWHHGMWGAESYSTEDFKLNMIDVGHWYELTLKRPASQYLLLYQVGSQWKEVDWGKKNIDQY